MRVMQQIIKRIFYLSCLCIAIFVSILHVSNTENNEDDYGMPYDKRIENKTIQTNKYKYLAILIIPLVIVVFIWALIYCICDRQSFGFWQPFFVNIFFRRNRANNAPVRDNDSDVLYRAIFYEDGRFDERLYRQVSGFLRNRFFRDQ